ncbi:hypothetical protein HOD08_02175, partial [bacterium]|nr:hypothetical protein [bacterium]
MINSNEMFWANLGYATWLIPVAVGFIVFLLYRHVSVGRSVRRLVADARRSEIFPGFTGPRRL